MSQNLLAYTQIASLVAFVIAVFALYRLLVNQKEATIELLREQNALLRGRIDELSETRPDHLAERLAKRVEIQGGELRRLSGDYEANQAVIREKEAELRRTLAELDVIRGKLGQIENAFDEAFCPDCGSVIVERAFHSESVYYQGRDIDVDHEMVNYECGRAVFDGEVRYECRNRRNDAEAGSGADGG